MKKVYFISIVFIVLTLVYVQYSKKGKTHDLDYSLSSKWQSKLNSAEEAMVWRNELLKNIETGQVNSQDYYKAVKQANSLKEEVSSKSTSSLNIEWVNRGPDSQGGRTRAILFDKYNANVIYTGGISGGLYKSEDGAQNWQRIDSYNGNNASIMSLAQSISGTIFVGTGEYLETPGVLPGGNLNNSSITGDGMYKSTDSGNTWTPIAATNVNATVELSTGNTNPTYFDDWAFISSLATHPTNSNLLMAGTKGGLKISINAESTQPSFSLALGMNGRVSDIKITDDGKEAWCAMNGDIYFSSDFTNNFSHWVLKNPTTNSTRAQLAISKVEPDGNYYVYVSSTDAAGCLAGIYKTEDKANTWTQIAYPGGLDPFAQPTEGGCQGWYDHALAVNPVDKEKIYIGGITFYTWGSGTAGLKRADVIGSETENRFIPNYLHADKHIIVFNPHDLSGNNMLIGHDGGISVSHNANTGFPDEIIFVEENKNYITLQCYSVGSGKYGEVIAGSQDNGSHYVSYKGISPKASREVSGGDGVAGAEISNLDPSITFSGYIYGALFRSFNYGETSPNFLSDRIDPAGCGHITCDALNTNLGETCSDIETEGQSFIFPFYLMETYNRLTPRNDLYVKAKNEEIILPSGEVEIIQETIAAGDVTKHIQYDKIPGLDLEGLGLQFETNQTLNPGQEQFFENKFDAKFFVPSRCGTSFFVCTNPLQSGSAPKFSAVDINAQSAIMRMDASDDGDMLVGVGENKVIIMQGWDAYDEINNPNSVTYETVSLGSSASTKVVGVSVSKQDKNLVMITLAGYGGTNKVYLSTNASSSNPSFSPIQNDLPVMPTYTCLIDKANSDRLLVGTELGIWSSSNGGVNWFEENEGMGGRFPIYAIRQEWMNNFDCDVISVGSFGAGMFTSTSLMDCAQKNSLVWGEPDQITAINDLEVDDLSIQVYPNPSTDFVNISFELKHQKLIDLSVYNVLGEKMFTKKLGLLAKGKTLTNIDVSKWSKGNYIVSIKSESGEKANRMFLKK